MDGKSVGLGDQDGGGHRRSALGLVFFRERSGRIQLCENLASDHSDANDFGRLVHPNNDVAAGWDDFFVPDLKVVGLLNISVEVLAGKTGLRSFERCGNWITENCADF